MPRASLPAKRQPGAASAQRDNSRSDRQGSNGKRIARSQHKSSANGAPSPGGDAVARPATSAGTSASSTHSLTSAGSSCPYPLAAAAVAAAANGCTREGDIMASSSTTNAHQQRHRNSDPSGSNSSSSRRSHASSLLAPRGQIGNMESANADTSSSSGAGSSASPAADSVRGGPAFSPNTPGPSAALAVSFDESHRRIDVNASKNANVHRDTGPLDLAITILRSCPLYDTIAILIILMQLSPVVLSVIYVLFTLLTFVPPVTTTSGLSLTEIFEGNLGNPAFATVLGMDIAMLLIWLFLWSPLQSAILDCAQVVIALTLGGSYNGNTPRQGSPNNLFVCIGIVIFSHISQLPSLERLPHLGPLFSADHASAFSDHGPSSYSYARVLRRPGSASWLRNAFGIHILTQGIVRYVREWYLRREIRNISLADTEVRRCPYIPEPPMAFPVLGGDGDVAQPPTGTALSHDASSNLGVSGPVPNNVSGVAGSKSPVATGSNHSSSIAEADPAIDLAASGNTSNGTNNILPLSMGNVSLKKKKKQSAMVRLRQPLWAALASTKIVMIKEYELSQAASESASTEATDADNLGNAPFGTQPGQIWICYVGHSEVSFSTSEFGGESPNYQADTSAASDNYKPFYVRINKARWQLTKIRSVDSDSDDKDETSALSPDGAQTASGLSSPGPSAEATASSEGTSRRLTKWSGDIYELTPSSSYEIEFLDTHTHKIIFSTSVRTAAAPLTSTSSAVATKAVQPPPGQVHKKESPATLIKNSIVSQEEKLNSEKQRLKALRKENNRRANMAKKEIDRVNASVQTAGSNDDKLKHKIAQSTAQRVQAEQAVRNLDEEIKKVSNIPDELVARHLAKKSEWDKEKSEFDGAVAKFNTSKNIDDKNIQGLKEDLSAIEMKKAKTTARLSKANSEHLQIVDANARGVDEAERQRQELANIKKEMARSQQAFKEQLSELVAINNSKKRTTETYVEAMRAFFSTFDAERPYDATYAFSSMGMNSMNAVGAMNGINGGNGLGGMSGMNNIAGINGINGVNGMAGMNSMHNVHGVNGIHGTASIPTNATAPSNLNGVNTPPPGLGAPGLQGSTPGTWTPASSQALGNAPFPTSGSAWSGHSSAAPGMMPNGQQYPPMLYGATASSMPFKMRARSSSMLSDMSGFTQSSTADDDAFFPGNNPNAYAQGSDSVYGTPSQAGRSSPAQAPLLQAGTIRAPPGFEPGSHRRSGSAPGSASSASDDSGSGDTESGCGDPASPV